MAIEPSQPSAFHIRIDHAIPHIDNKHVQDRLESPLWNELLRSGGDLRCVLDTELQRSLQRQVFVEYEQYDQTGRFLHSTREYITRAGFIGIVRMTADSHADLVTAFFPAETFDARRQRRWMAAQESRIKVYACHLIAELALTHLVPPSQDDAFPSKDPAGERRAVRFVEQSRWGIRTIQLGGASLLVFGKPPPWPEE